MNTHLTDKQTMWFTILFHSLLILAVLYSYWEGEPARISTLWNLPILLLITQKNRQSRYYPVIRLVLIAENLLVVGLGIGLGYLHPIALLFPVLLVLIAFFPLRKSID